MSVVNSNSLRASDVELLIQALQAKLRNERSLVEFVGMQLEHVAETLRMSTGDWCQKPSVSLPAAIVIAAFTSARITIESGPDAETVVLPPTDYVCREGPFPESYDTLSIALLKEHLHMVRGTKLVMEQFGATFDTVPVLADCFFVLKPFLAELEEEMESHLRNLHPALDSSLDALD